MACNRNSPPPDPMKQAEIDVAIAEELHRLADEATERARASCERANCLPLLDRLKSDR